jgi:oxygen-independent coproporphyrinogen-3 oxidase
VQLRHRHRRDPGRIRHRAETLSALYKSAAEAFPGMTSITPDGFEITDEGRPLARMIARAFDGYEMRAEGHSAAF